MKKNKKSKISADRKFFSSEKKGFSLVETLIAIFVFSLVMAMLAGAFSGFLKKYVSAKKEQRSAESAQYVMNLMAKTIRTSTVQSISPTQIQMFDNSTGNCVLYIYMGQILQTSLALQPNMASCNWFLMINSLSTLTSSGDIVGATFAGTASSDPLLGKVTISLSVPGNTPTTSSQIQTTVSLRQ